MENQNNQNDKPAEIHATESKPEVLQIQLDKRQSVKENVTQETTSKRQVKKIKTK